MCTARGEEPLPVSINHGVRSPFVLHRPRPFQPAFGSSILASRPFAKMLPPVVTAIRGLQIADTCFYYPEDRGISESVRIGKLMAERIS